MGRHIPPTPVRPPPWCRTFSDRYVSRATARSKWVLTASIYLISKRASIAFCTGPRWRPAPFADASIVFRCSRQPKVRTWPMEPSSLDVWDRGCKGTRPSGGIDERQENRDCCHGWCSDFFAGATHCPKVDGFRGWRNPRREVPWLCRVLRFESVQLQEFANGVKVTSVRADLTVGQPFWSDARAIRVRSGPRSHEQISALHMKSAQNAVLSMRTVRFLL